MTTLDQFNLAALDEEDLAVLSAHLQGAVLKVADLAYLPGDKRFAFVASRVPATWAVSEAARRGEACNKRRITGVHFERVQGVATRGIDRGQPEAELEIVAIGFTPVEAPGGYVTIFLTNHRDIRLQVECIEAACRDLQTAFAAGAEGNER